MSRIRILVVTTRNLAPKHVRDIRTRLKLGSVAQLELLTVDPPRQRLAVHRVDSVELSRIPYRPVVPVSGPGLRTWGRGPKAVTRALRAGRRLSARVRRTGAGVDRAAALEIACRTSRQLVRRAEQVNVIVSLEAAAVPAVAALARRTDKPLAVHRPDNVRSVLEIRGWALPPVPTMDESRAEADLALIGMELPPPPEPAPRSILITPANYAGQAHAWAESVRLHVPGATAMNAQVGAHPKFPFKTDYDVHRDVFTGSLRWRTEWRAYVMKHFTHVVAEVNRPFLGQITGDGQTHVAEMLAAGKTVALLSHGSDARIPSVHAAREPWHSYDALEPRTVASFERAATRNCEIYNGFEGTVFVSTPGLIAFVPKAVWLPLVIDYDDWHTDLPPMQRELPVVAHIPSSAQKGSHMIDPVLASMHERGLIEYRRVSGVPHEKMPEMYGTADLVVEQFGIADYSTAAVEAMAAGRVVVSRVADSVREHVREKTGRELPIVEANPTTLEQVILDLVADRERARTIAKQGQEFAREIHDGRRSAAVLGAWLDSTS